MPSLVRQDLGIEEWFRSHARSQPDAEAVVDGDHILSYRDVDILADRLATQLSAYGIDKEEPIGVLLPRGFVNVVVQVAILRVGASCVPLDVSLPDQRIRDLYNGLEVRIVFVGPEDSSRVPHMEQITLTRANLSPGHLGKERIGAVDDDKIIPAETGADHRTHVLHTSGTTGLPKPVEILSKSLTRIAFNSFVLRPKETDRVAHIAAPSFDAALFEIWTTLAVGGTIVILPKDVVINPWALYESLSTYRISSIVISPALLHHTVRTVPHAFAALDVVLTGGEAAEPRVLRALLEAGAPKQLINGYGPTECSVVASYHEVRLEDCRDDYIPIGRPLDRTSLYILDKSGVPVAGGEVGEIYIGGDAVARGYYNRPAANAKSFVQMTGLAKTGKSELLYRTGDLGRYTEDGLMVFVSRMDDAVKIRGHLINLREVEAALMKSELIEQVCVQAIQRPDKERHIVAFTTFKDHDNDLLSELVAYMKQTIPSYSIPRIEPRTAFPITTHGKIDSKTLVLEYTQRIERAGGDAASPLDPGAESPLLWLQRLWTSVLDVSGATPDSDFFDLGGSSLQAASILIGIRRHYDTEISMQQLYDAPTPRQMLELLCSSSDPTGADSSRLDEFMADSKLADRLYPLPGACPEWSAPDEGRIFMTGATGYLGREFLRAMIQRADVREVRCLVRCPDAVHGRARLVSAFPLSATSQAHKIVVVPGDLAQDRLGLAPLEFARLARWASAVFHFGAYVSYVRPYGAARPVNVLGTLNCIKLAITGRAKALHYMSTPAVLGPASFLKTKRIMEDHDLGSCAASLPYDTGYAQSKWVAEQLVRGMMAKGMPAVVYRPGQVMGDGIAGPVNDNDFLTRFVRGCCRLGARPILPDQNRLMIPVDWFTAVVVHASARARNLGRTLHCVPRCQQDSMDLEAMWGVFQELGCHVQALPFRAWADRLADDPRVLDNPLFPMLPLFQRVVLRDRTLWELQEGMGVFDARWCEEVVGDLEWKAGKSVDREFLGNFWRAVMVGYTGGRGDC